MEGTLWKWTNYFNGWQQRWFILQNGILSYYLNSGDVNESCKGSLKIPACDILTYHSDPVRMDLIIPGEAYFYLKASNQQEKQKWLKFFGSAKACYSNSGKLVSSNETTDKADAVEMLSVKKSELRVYCDLLTQQVNEIKSSFVENPRVSTETDAANGSSNVLGATCDAFVRILDDCMQLSGATIRRPSSRSHETSPESSKMSSPFATTPQKIERQGSHLYDDRNSIVQKNPGIIANSSLEQDLLLVNHSANHQLFKNGDSEKHNIQCVPTFFSQIQFSFVDIRLTNQFEIPTLFFLDACRNFITIFDRLQETAFIPGKLDMSCNIKKIYQKHLCDTDTYNTLEAIMMQEARHSMASNLNSATLAILWLLRSLDFAEKLLRELIGAKLDADFSGVATLAYQATLASYHGPVIRNAFSIAISSAPSVQTMISRLLDTPYSDQSKCGNHSNGPIGSENTESLTNGSLNSSVYFLRKDIMDYVEGLKSILQILNKFILENNLGFNDKV